MVCQVADLQQQQQQYECERSRQCRRRSCAELPLELKRRLQVPVLDPSQQCRCLAEASLCRCTRFSARPTLSSAAAVTFVSSVMPVLT